MTFGHYVAYVLVDPEMVFGKDQSKEEGDSSEASVMVRPCKMLLPSDQIPQQTRNRRARRRTVPERRTEEYGLSVLSKCII